MFHRNARVPQECGQGAHPQPSGPWLCQRQAEGQPQGTPHSHHAERTCACPRAGSCGPVQWLRAEPQSEHSSHGPSPELGTSKHSCVGRCPSTRGARDSFHGEKTDLQRLGRLSKARAHLCSYSCDTGILSTRRVSGTMPGIRQVCGCPVALPSPKRH